MGRVRLAFAEINFFVQLLQRMALSSIDLLRRPEAAEIAAAGLLKQAVRQQRRNASVCHRRRSITASGPVGSGINVHIIPPPGAQLPASDGHIRRQ